MLVPLNLPVPHELEGIFKICKRVHTGCDKTCSILYRIEKPGILFHILTRELTG